MAITKRREIRQRIHLRVRKKVRGTAERPRLAVFFSNKNVCAQIINDDESKTICAANTTEKVLAGGKANIASAIKIGHLIAERAHKANVEAVVFDRGGVKFHGKVKALADAAREKGLKF